MLAINNFLYSAKIAKKVNWAGAPAHRTNFKRGPNRICCPGQSTGVAKRIAALCRCKDMPNLREVLAEIFHIVCKIFHIFVSRLNFGTLLFGSLKFLH